MMVLVSGVGLAQSEQNDTIKKVIVVADSMLPETGGMQPTPRDYESLSYFNRMTAAELLALQMRQGADLGIVYTPIMAGEATPVTWKNGGVMVSGGRESLPGLMGIERGEAGIYQQAGRFSFYAGGIVNKYGSFQGLQTQWGMRGNLSYMISSDLTISAFGEYYSNGAPRTGPGLPFPPSIVGYYGYTKFGAKLDYSINDRWGVETGMQMVQPTGMRSIEAEPIVTPYYKLGSGKHKVKIGLPVGQILYHMIRRR